MIIKQGTQYLITEKGTVKGKTLKITAYVEKDHTTIFNNVEQLDFTFYESKPEMIQKIAKMLLQAGKLT